MSFTAWNAYETKQETGERRMDLAADLAALENRAAVLTEDITELKNPYGVEAELRRRYEVGKEGEHAIVLIEEEAEVDVDSEPEPEDTGFWATLFGIVF